MMKKDILIQAAENLIRAEVHVRSILPTGLGIAYVESLRDKCREIRMQIPELQNRKYWFDIPFRPELPLLTWGDPFQMPDGRILVSDSLTFSAKTVKIMPTASITGQELLNLLRTSPGKAAVYINRKELKKDPDAAMDVKNIYMIQHDVVSPDDKYVDGPTEPDSIALQMLREDIARQLESLQSERSKASKSFDERADSVERLFNALEKNRFMTNQEDYLTGGKSDRDYFEQDLFREMIKDSKMGTYDQREAELRHRLAQAETVQRKAQFEYARALLQSKNKYRNCSMVTTCQLVGHILTKGDLPMAYVVVTGLSDVYEICHNEYPEVGQLPNGYERVVHEKAEIPDYERTMQFFANQLRIIGKRCRVLSSCPLGADDIVWRAWMETYWKNSVQYNEY